MTYRLLRKSFQQARRENTLFRRQKISCKERREGKSQFTLKRVKAGTFQVLNAEILPQERNTSEDSRPTLR